MVSMPACVWRNRFTYTVAAGGRRPRDLTVAAPGAGSAVQRGHPGAQLVLIPSASVQAGAQFAGPGRGGAAG
jgi:hypothetical protein